MTKLALGLMSGTSGDGVSLALCSFQKRSFKILHDATFTYPKPLATVLPKVLSLSTSEVSKLHTELGIFFATCAVRFLKKFRVPFSHVTVIGSHGHTVYHGPYDEPRNTFQIGEPSYLAEKIGAPVVADFRPRDVAVGGQGAPLVPFFDQYFYGGGKIRALQNIGGIGNVTLVGKGVRTTAFDTGPGNCLIDLEVQRSTRGRALFDRDGQIAARGQINLKILNDMLQHPYLRQKPPKSTGREIFDRDFIDYYLHKESSADRIAALTFYTAASIFISYRKFLPRQPQEILVSGGGAYNKTLMHHLADLFKPVPVKSLDTLGVPSQAKEPAAFAFLAWRAIRGEINHLPETTGAKEARILGKIIL